jgi:hypothetical protein
MSSLFLTFLVIGAVVLLIQLVLGFTGIDGDGLFEEGHGDASDGLDLFTVRALSAAAAAFGVVGLGLMQVGLAGWLALPIALVTGIAAAVGVASTLRSLKRLEQDKSFVVESAIGLPATVALGIPGAKSGEGKIHLIAHERFQEFNAVTEEEAIPSGTPVFVVDVLSPDTLVVARSLSLLEETNDRR